MDRSTRRRVPRSDCRFPRSLPKVSVENRPALPAPCTRRDRSRTQRRLLLPHANPGEPPLGPAAACRTLVSYVVCHPAHPYAQSPESYHSCFSESAKDLHTRARKRCLEHPVTKIITTKP